MITLGSLFDGSGGFPLGGALYGIEPIWASEIEPFPIRVTTKRFPSVKHYGDISAMDGAEVEPVDVITFGSPCQDMSVAGKRAGMKHSELGDEEATRSGLFMEAVRIIREMQEATCGVFPRFAVWENVPGAFSSNKGEDFYAVIEELIKVADETAVIPRPPKGKWLNAGQIVGDGYSLAWRVLDAQYWGVPQRRRRIFLVADFAGQSAPEILFKPESVSRDPAQSSSPGQGSSGDFERCTPKTMLIRCGCDGGGKGALIQEDKSATLSCNNVQTLFEPIPITDKATRYSGGGPTRKNDGAGNGLGVGKPGDPSPTLSCGDRHAVLSIDRAAFNQGANALYDFQISEDGVSQTLVVKGPNAVCASKQYLFENHSQDTRYVGPLDVSPIISATFGMGGNNQPFVVSEAPTVLSSLQDHAVISDEDVCPTLVSAMGDGGGHTPMLTIPAYSIGNGQADQTGLHEEIIGCLNCMHDQQAIMAPFDGYAVRRLTPTECARLQGFPDWWCDELETSEPTNEEIEFWAGVWETHRSVMDTSEKPKSKTQLLKWLKDPRSDSAEYKMWGNGVALPCVCFVLGGISEVLSNED